jgi:rhodanese-related sulfurtransferase
MQDITVEELRHRMNQGEKLNIIDVREEWEYEEFNIGAKLIPLGELPQHMDYLNQFKEQELILHCRSGGRSGQAKQFLASKGFTKVRNLLGGMLEWQKTAVKS